MTCGASVTFHEHVAPILWRQCAPCHRAGESGPFPLITFAEAKKKAREIVEVTETKRMPPWLPAAGVGEFQGARVLTDLEIKTLGDWVAQGTPAGDESKAQPAPAWPGGWQLGTPDLIVEMPQTYVVPAAGQDLYRHFVIPVPTDGVRHVAAWEFRPGSRAVHHAFLRLDRQGIGRRLAAQEKDAGFPGMDTPAGLLSPNGHFASWQPGAGPHCHPEGLGWSLPPAVDLVIQMHLQPQGKPEPLRASVGFYFTRQAPTNQPVKVGLVNYRIDIPAHATNVVVADDFELPADADLLGLLPHTHYLGRRIRAWAQLPDRTEKPLLSIPAWDFNWQGDYICRQPVFLPAGTRLRMQIGFDNSTNNHFNPSRPPRRVRFGQSTRDEMAEVWFQVLPRTAAGKARLDQANLERTARDTLAYNEERIRQDPQDGMARVNIGRALLSQGRNQDARLRFEEALAINPALDEAHYYLGVLSRMKGDPRSAEARFRQALALNPNHARAHGNLGLLLVDVPDLKGAAEQFQAAVQLDSSDALAHGMLGALRLNENRVDEAITLLSRAAELDPNNEAVRNNLNLARRRRLPR